MDDNIILNDFMFCSRHGHEYCHRCGVDHRFTNNYQIQDELGNILEEVDFFDLDGRTSLNVYDYGASRNSNHTCVEHRRADCAICFDWKSVITAEIQEAAHRERWLAGRKRYFDRVDHH